MQQSSGVHNFEYLIVPPTPMLIVQAFSRKSPWPDWHARGYQKPKGVVTFYTKWGHFHRKPWIVLTKTGLFRIATYPCRWVWRLKMNVLLFHMCKVWILSRQKQISLQSCHISVSNVDEAVQHFMTMAAARTNVSFKVQATFWVGQSEFTISGRM